MVMLYNDSNKYLTLLKKDKYLLKFVIEKLFTFGDLSRSLSNVDSSTGNISCPFHPSEGFGENKSQSAKVYYSEEKNIYTLHCFTSKKTYTVYDYIEKVMEKSPYDFLVANRDNSEIVDIVDVIEKGYVDLNNDIVEKRVNYVDTVFEECEGATVDYIDKLYGEE